LSLVPGRIPLLNSDLHRSGCSNRQRQAESQRMPVLVPRLADLRGVNPLRMVVAPRRGRPKYERRWDLARVFLGSCYWRSRKGRGSQVRLGSYSIGKTLLPVLSPLLPRSGRKKEVNPAGGRLGAVAENESRQQRFKTTPAEIRLSVLLPWLRQESWLTPLDSVPLQLFGETMTQSRHKSPSSCGGLISAPYRSDNTR